MPYDRPYFSKKLFALYSLKPAMLWDQICKVAKEGWLPGWEWSDTAQLVLCVWPTRRRKILVGCVCDVAGKRLTLLSRPGDVSCTDAELERISVELLEQLRLVLRDEIVVHD